MDVQYIVADFPSKNHPWNAFRSYFVGLFIVNLTVFLYRGSIKIRFSKIIHPELDPFLYRGSIEIRFSEIIHPELYPFLYRGSIKSRFRMIFLEIH